MNEAYFAKYKTSILDTLQRLANCSDKGKEGFWPVVPHSYLQFRGLPFTTKQLYQENPTAFLCVSPDLIVDESATSGTVGAPVSIPLTEADLERLAENEKISLQTAGLKKGDIVQLMCTLDRRFMAGLAYFMGLRKLGCKIIRTGGGMPALQLDSILQMKPTILIAVPTVIVKMLSIAEEQNINPNKLSVRKIICIGEPIRNPDFSLNALGKRITESWQVKLFSTYASSEMQTAFTECEQGNGGHVIDSLIFCEVLDDNGNPVAPGETGELVVTNFGVEALPLIRFKTGDMIQYFENDCSCGRKGIRLGPVLGRKNQSIKLKGTTLFPLAIANALDEVKEITSYLIELKTDVLGLDDVVIKYFSNDDSAHSKASSILQSRLRIIPEFQLCKKEDLLKIKIP